MSEFIFPVSLSGFFFLAGVTLMFLGLRHSEPIERPIGLVDKKKPAEAGRINAEDTERVRSGVHVRDTSIKRYG
jgi:hypothetical protein